MRVAVVAAAALVHGLVWVFVLPPFQAPDETTHVAYVQRLAETGERPGESSRPEFSTEQRTVMDAIGTERIIRRPQEKVLDGPAREAADAVVRAAEQRAPRDDGGGASTVSPQPPLFYALAAVPYTLASGATLPARVRAMRVLSALLFAMTAALCALLVAQLLPGRPWAVLVGGLAVALQPVFAFASSAVNPDALLATLCAAVLLVLVRCAREGPTPRRLVALGALTGAGAITKLTFVAFLPLVLATVAWLLVRDRRGDGAPVLGPRAVGAAVGAGLVLPVAYVAWALAQGAPLLPVGLATSNLPAEEIEAGTLTGFVSYTWQLYLPRLPFQEDAFGFIAPYHTWLKGMMGEYGWLDYEIAGVWIALGGVLFAVAVVLAGRAVLTHRDALRQRAPVAAILVVATGSVLLLIAIAGYDYKRTTGLPFEQARYLLPLAGIYAGFVAVACLGLGRRRAPLLAAVTVMLLIAHAASGPLLTLSRYHA